MKIFALMVISRWKPLAWPKPEILEVEILGTAAPSLTALYRTLSSKAPALRDLTILLAAHSAPRSVKTFPDNSATLRKVLQSRLESPDLAPIESLTLSEHLVGAEVDWFIQNTALTRVPSDDVWSIEEGSEEVDSSEYESGEADDADV